MKYFIHDDTLFLRGRFYAASTGIEGGVGEVGTLLNHTVEKDFFHGEPIRYLNSILEKEGFSGDFFGLLTAVPMKNLCILSYGFITVFVTAGVSNPNPEGPGTINIIVHSRERLSSGALLEVILTATEAKAHALSDMEKDFFGTTTDAVISACEGGDVLHEYAGTLTGAGSKTYECVRFGVKEALKRYEGEIMRTHPSFFVYSSIGGDHWIEWSPDNCPYYPCHFPGQMCDFCYCPYYPCGDEDLGHWVESSSGVPVWSCESCSLVHIPGVVRHMKQNPEASLAELKKLAEKKD